MKRRGFKRKVKPVSREAKRANPLKPSTRSQVRKGPIRDPKHLARVREYGCIGHGIEHPVFWKTIEAHHIRFLGGRTMGKRKSDYLTVPLCVDCHATLHEGSEEMFWMLRGVNPSDFIQSFSEEGRKAIAELRGGI